MWGRFVNIKIVLVAWFPGLLLGGMDAKWSAAFRDGSWSGWDCEIIA